jgi:hypothetical protein
MRADMSVGVQASDIDRLQLQHNSARSARDFNGSHPTQVGKEPENNKPAEAIIKTQEKKVER